MKQLFWFLGWPIRIIMLILIRLYQYTLSAFIGRSCRHMPTCSEFTFESIRKHGAWAGGWIGLARISRCRPWGTDGYDPVPETVPSQARWFRPWGYGRWR